MKYEEIPKLSKSEIEAMLESNDRHDIAVALVSAAMYGTDQEWVQSLCISALTSSDIDRKYAAIISLGHYVRLHGYIDRRVGPLLEEALNEQELAENVELLLDQIRIYGSCDASSSCGGV